MLEIFKQFDYWAAIDVVLVAFIIYHLLLLISGTRAGQILKGLFIIFVLFLISKASPLTMLNWTMSKFYSSFIIILVIIFQDDIRRMLSKMGNKPFITTADGPSYSRLIDEVSRGAQALAEKRIGALIVVERNIILSKYVELGTRLDARISKEILVSIFQHSSPIHDGAVIIQQGLLSSAGCFLPLTNKESLDPNLGTRHRAAIGLSEETDAIIIVVSEELGSISLVMDGLISRRLDSKALRTELRELLLPKQSLEEQADQENKSSIIDDVAKIFKKKGQ